MSIITVTLNPVIDQTITVKELKAGEVHRAQSVYYTAGGKGIMVASCLADWHDEPIAVTGFLGIENAVVFKSVFQEKKIEDKFIHVAGTNRTNIKIVDDHQTTDVNLPGISSTEADLQQLLQSLEMPYDIVILSGSLPLNCSNDAYAQMLEVLKKTHSKVIVDASGEALIEALQADIKPYCIKPNLSELSQWAGRNLSSMDDIYLEARKLLATGIQLVVISLGEAGALFCNQNNILKACLKASTILTSVGAGDAMVAGIATALRENASLERIARLSTAFAVAKLGSIAPSLPNKDTIESLAENVVIEQIGG